VVVQMGNAAAGSAVAQVTGPGTVLDVAAPSTVEACLGRDSFLELAGTRFVTAEVEVERYASVVPINSSQKHLMFVLRSLGVRPTFTSDRYGRTRGAIGALWRSADHGRRRQSRRFRDTCTQT
jgi:hypothetical protein